MSIRCEAESYSARKFTFRISVDPTTHNIRDEAVALARYIEKVLAIDGSNIIYGDGRWKGETENGATIEAVRRMDNRLVDYSGLITHVMECVSKYVNLTLGLTCFATVEPTTAYELYELAE